MDYVKYTPLCNGFASSNLAATINYVSSGSYQYYSYIVIYSGAAPTQAQINAANEAYFTSRASSSLLTFNISRLNAASVNSDGNGITISPRPYTAATRTGTATWFAIYTTYSDLAIIGDVSDLNGTGFLKMESTDIVSGGLYRIPEPLVMNLPTEYQMG